MKLAAIGARWAQSKATPSAAPASSAPDTIRPRRGLGDCCSSMPET